MAEDSPHSPSASPASAPAPASAARNTLGLFGTRLLTFPLTIVTGILVARYLGPADLGVYKFLLLIGSFVLPLLSFGFGASIIYYISSKRYQVADVFLTCLVMGIVQGAFNAVLVGVLWKLDWLGKTAAGVPANLMLPILLVSPLQGALLMLTRVVVSDSWFSLNNLITLATPLVTSGSLLLLVVVFGWELEGTVAAIVFSNVMVISFVLAKIQTRYHPTWTLHWPFVAEAMRYGIRSWPADVALRANLRLDQWLLGMFAPSAQLGFYSIAVNISELLWMLPDSLAFVLFNRMAAERDTSERTRLTAQVHRVLFVAVAVTSVVAGLSGFWVIPFFYGEDYREACVPLLLLIPGTVAFTTSKVITKFFGASGMPGKASVMAVAGAVVGVGLYVAVIPIFGMIGAAIASSLSYLTMAAVAYWLYRVRVSPEPTRLFRFTSADPAWAMAQFKAAFKRR